MKNVLGGLHAGGSRADGQTLYNCTNSGPCGSETGSTCGASAADAELKNLSAHIAQGTYTDCFNRSSCTSTPPVAS